MINSSMQLLSEPLFSLSLLPGIDFSLIYVENKGMAWGMFSSFQWVIFSFRVALVSGLFVAFFKNAFVKKHFIAFLLIAFGALGNIVDTIIYGYVIDMLHFTFWGRSYGVFNVADAMIFIGAFLALITKEETNEELT